MKNCTKCGAQNPDEAQFCYNCGESFVAKVKTQVGQSSTSQPSSNSSVNSFWDFFLTMLFSAITPGINLIMLCLIAEKRKNAGVIVAFMLGIVMDIIAAVLLVAVYRP